MHKISVPILRQYAVIITVNLLALCMGMDLGWPSPVMVKLRDTTQTPLSRPITTDEDGWIVSVGYIFSTFALPFMGILMDYIGRRYSILMPCLLKIVGGVITIFATEIWMLLVARVINGVTTATGMIAITVYCTEISSKEIRGTLGTILSIMSNVGILVMLGIGPYISYINLCIMVTVVSICASIPQFFIPDTPYSLYDKGKIEEAKKVLKFFRGSDALAEEELKELSHIKPCQKFDKREIFRNKVYFKTFAIVLVLGSGVQLVGFNFISFYLQTILELSNTTVSPALGSVITGVIQISASIFASVFIDKFGRRPMLISSLLAMAVGMNGLGIFFMVKQQSEINGLLNYLPLVSIALVTCGFCGGIGCLYFVIVTELLDGPIRAIAATSAIVAANFIAFLLARYTMSILTGMGPDATFFMFGAICIMMSLFIYFFVPETKQKSIAEIQKALGAYVEDEERKVVTKF